MEKIQVVLNDEATKEFLALSKDPVLGELAKRYLRELHDFPPEAWGDIHRKEGQFQIRQSRDLRYPGEIGPQ